MYLLGFEESQALHCFGVRKKLGVSWLEEEGGRQLSLLDQIKLGTRPIKPVKEGPCRSGARGQSKRGAGATSVVQVRVWRDIQGIPWFTFDALRGSPLDLSVIGISKPGGYCGGSDRRKIKFLGQIAPPRGWGHRSPKVKTGVSADPTPFLLSQPNPSLIEALRPQRFQPEEGLGLRRLGSPGPQTGFPTSTGAGTSQLWFHPHHFLSLLPLSTLEC